MTFSAQSPRPDRPLASDIAAALDWWREAGVSNDFTDAARDWLEDSRPAPVAEPAATARTNAPPPPPAAPPIGGLPESWPQDIAAFIPWWLGEPSLDDGQVFARIPPRGNPGADLMVLVDHPEAGDTDVLLSGEQGRMLAAILSALGIPPEKAYVASVLPRHTPLPDWAALAAGGLGKVALHHVALAAPKRLISFGPHVSSLIGHDPANKSDPLAQFYHVGASIPALAAPSLATLLARPRGKAGLWRALLDWHAA